MSGIARLTAIVRTAVPLREDETRTLQEILTRHFHASLQLEVQIDPTILGGLWVRVADTVIDGSVQGRLEALRHHLRMQARIIIAGAAQAAESKDRAP